MMAAVVSAGFLIAPLAGGRLRRLRPLGAGWRRRRPFPSRAAECVAGLLTLLLILPTLGWGLFWGGYGAS